jgi:predicted TIM-barrel fold metal-dependent hydrolase
MAAMHRTIRVERVVIVNPSVYGTDNSSTTYGLKARSGTARGIAVIDDRISDRELRTMDAAGFRGIRLNLSTVGISDPQTARARFLAAAGRMKDLGWHIQMFTNLAVIASIKDLVAEASVAVVFDHFGGAQAALGPEQPGFSDLLGLLKSGRAYVKISGAYLASKQAPDYPDVTPVAQALISANPDRVLWGTDWPHPDATSNRAPTEVSPLRPIDDGRLFNRLPLWAPDPGIRRKILVENPAKLYRF